MLCLKPKTKKLSSSIRNNQAKWYDQNKCAKFIYEISWRKAKCGLILLFPQIGLKVKVIGVILTLFNECSQTLVQKLLKSRRNVFASCFLKFLIMIIYALFET